MKGFIIAASLFALSCGGSAESAPPPAGNGVVVLELFTSQGCSSCPPADALLSKTGGDSVEEVRRNLDAFLAAQRAY